MSSIPAATIDVSQALEETLPNASAPATMNGPIINDRPTIITILSPDQLAVTPLLEALVTITNEAFGNSHDVLSFFPPGTLRLRSTHQIIDELQSDAVTFTCIITSPYTVNETGEISEDVQIFGMVTGKHYEGKLAPNFPEALTVFKRKPAPPPVDEEQWELLLLAVNLKIQKQGLATFLINFVEQEVRRRFEAKERLRDENNELNHEPKPRPRQLRMLLNTIKELNEHFYKRYGYETTEEQVCPVGTFGCKKAFTQIMHDFED